MNKVFTLPQLLKQFPTNEACLEEIKKLRFHDGIRCRRCRKITNHYKIFNRLAYSCEYCRHQVYPLKHTIFQKTTTPLRIWFYAMFLMTQTKGGISIRQLQKELHVTYKTAWRIYTKLRKLMAKNNADLLSGATRIQDLLKPKVSWTKFTIFNQFEIMITEKEQPANK